MMTWTLWLCKGHIRTIVWGVCRALLGSHAHLRSSALLALTKLMAIDPAFCDANLPLVFTLLEKRSAALS